MPPSVLENIRNLELGWCFPMVPFGRVPLSSTSSANDSRMSRLNAFEGGWLLARPGHSGVMNERVLKTL